MASNSFEEYCLRWTDHDSLLHRACEGLLTSEKFADVTLFCEGQSLKCHKFILSACSTYFDRILAESPACDHPVVILKDVPYKQMSSLLHFIYRGEVTAEERELNSLVELAHSLSIKGIGEYASPRRSYKIESTTEISRSLQNASLHVINDAIPNIHDNHLGEILPDDPNQDSTYHLQETEVEYELHREPMEDVADQSMGHALPAQFAEDPSSSSISQKRTAESEGDVSSDASASMPARACGVGTVYKRYSEENLLAAVRAVVEDGVKQVDASLKFGIPFTTLTRKTRLYRKTGGQLWRSSSSRTKEKNHPSVNNDVLVADVPAESIVLEGPTFSDPSATSLEMDSELMVVIHEPDEVVAAATATSTIGISPPGMKQYKTYTEESLRQAITAVLYGTMKAADASHRYGIPLTTLTRKIRSSREVHTSSSTCNRPAR